MAMAINDPAVKTSSIPKALMRAYLPDIQEITADQKPAYLPALEEKRLAYWLQPSAQVPHRMHTPYSMPALSTMAFTSRPSGQVRVQAGL
jgi:hypothetical protein